MPLESAITRRIMDYLRTIPNSYILKLHGSVYSRRGVPDILFVWDGHAFFFEVKGPRGKLSKAQVVQAHRLGEAGATVAVVGGVDEVKDVIACG